MAVRVTQEVIQVGFTTTPDARVTAVAAEVLLRPAAPTARVTGIAMEVLHSVSGTPAVPNRPPIMSIIVSG